MRTLFVLLMMSIGVAAQIAPVPGTPVSIIVDGDSGNDISIDDGLYFAIRLQQMGYVNILAFTVSSSSWNIPESAAYAKTYLNWANLPTVPVGAYHGGFPSGAQYVDNDYCHYTQGQTTLQNCPGEMPHQVGNVSSYPSISYTDAVTVLRKALAGASNGSVVMIETGVSQNFNALLNSPADSISALTGAQLISAKVQYLIQMGGKYPTSTPSCCTPQGAEWNFQHAPSDAANISTNWPTVIYYSGFEVGYPDPVLGTGIYTLPSTNPLYIAHQIYGSETRNGWDVSAILFAIQGTTNGYFSLSAAGSNSIDTTTGANTFSTSSPPTPARYYLVMSRTAADFQALLNPLLSTDIHIAAAPSALRGKSGLAGKSKVH